MNFEPLDRPDREKFKILQIEDGGESHRLVNSAMGQIPCSSVVIDIFQKYRRYSILMPILKVSSIPISILCRKSIDIEIDTSISILL